MSASGRKRLKTLSRVNGRFWTRSRTQIGTNFRADQLMKSGETTEAEYRVITQPRPEAELARSRYS